MPRLEHHLIFCDQALLVQDTHIMFHLRLRDCIAHEASLSHMLVVQTHSIYFSHLQAHTVSV
jgi:hypothetical protein